MALTQAEQQELDLLEAQEAKAQGLTLPEYRELQQLEEQDRIANLPILNESPEGLSGRFAVKNFGSSSGDVIGYLKEQNPGFDFKIEEKSGEILAKNSKDNQWGRLDPQGLDLPGDLTDIAYDVPAGIAQGIATGAAGIAGAAGSPYALGAGAIPAAMATSAATGAGLEAGRQGIGRMLGIKDNFDTGDTAFAGGVGAVSPLLFGTGAGAKDALKAAVKSGLDADTLLKMQKGYGGKLYDKAAEKIFPYMGMVAGGYDPKVLKTAYDNLDSIKLAENNPLGAANEFRAINEIFSDSLKEASRKSGKTLENLRNQQDSIMGTIPLEEITNPLNSYISKIDANQLQNAQSSEAKAAAQDVLSRLFSTTGDNPSPITNVNVAQARQLAEQLKDEALSSGLNFNNMGSTKSLNTNKLAKDKQLLNALSEASGTLNQKIDSTVGVMDPELLKKITAQKEAYSALATLKDEFANPTNKQATFNNFLKRNDLESKALKQQMEEYLPDNMKADDVAAKIQAYDLFAKPGWMIPAMGNANTTRSILGGGGGAALGAASAPEGTPWLDRAPYMLAGAGLGAGAAGPKAIRGMMSASKGARSAVEKQGKIGNIMKFMPYMLMKSETDPEY